MAKVSHSFLSFFVVRGMTLLFSFYSISYFCLVMVNPQPQLTPDESSIHGNAKLEKHHYLSIGVGNDVSCSDELQIIRLWFSNP